MSAGAIAMGAPPQAGPLFQSPGVLWFVPSSPGRGAQL